MSLSPILGCCNVLTVYDTRQQMDSRGWIPISLLASFNRVRQLTLDQRLVRDVLALSTIAEVRNDFVRLGAGEWARFVLPGAPASTVEVEGGEVGGHQQGGQGGESGSGPDQDRDHAEEDAEGEEEEDEDEIEIVMGGEGLGQAWVMPSPS
jgi:la-related protein 1